MLDVPIWTPKGMVGVVCQEHIGPKRTWHKEEAVIEPDIRELAGPCILVRLDG